MVPFRLALTIAVRHLLARRRQTILAVLGVVVGGAIFALMVALTVGQGRFLREKLIDTSPHIVVRSQRLNPIVARSLLPIGKGGALELITNVPPTARSEVKPYTGILARLEKLSTDVAAVAPLVLLQGVYRNGARYQTVSVRGVVPGRERNIARLARSIRQGSLDALERTPSGTVIGRGLARKLGVDIGGRISFITPAGTVEQIVVVAIFESGVASFDDARGYINLSLAQSIRGMQRNAVSGLSIQVVDLDRVDAIRDRVQRITGYVAETWEESNGQVLALQARQQSTTQLLVIFVFVTAAFGIANTIAAIVLQKKPDIAIMKTFGVSRSGLASIFLLEGAMIGLVGGLLAAVGGYWLASLFGALDLFPRNSERASVRFDTFPVSLDLTIYAVTFGLSLVKAMLASLLPARRAARYAPVPIIRGEV